jgi:hypothetical protein
MKTFKVNRGEALKSRLLLSYIFDLEEVKLVFDTCRLGVQPNHELLPKTGNIFWPMLSHPHSCKSYSCRNDFNHPAKVLVHENILCLLPEISLNPSVNIAISFRRPLGPIVHTDNLQGKHLQHGRTTNSPLNTRLPTLLHPPTQFPNLRNPKIHLDKPHTKLLPLQPSVENRPQSRNNRKDPHLLQQTDSTYPSQSGNQTLILGKIKMEFLQELVNGMVENGQAEWVGKNTRVQALLFWYKPEEWANMMSNWVNTSALWCSRSYTYF